MTARAAWVLARGLALWVLLFPRTARSAPSIGGGQDSLAGRIEGYMQALVALDRFSGAVLVARDGHILHAAGYGLANVEWSVPNGVDTKFRIGSITKQFTAAAILLLEQQGKLHVSDPVCRYLPDCPTAWHAITIEELLTHTAGIADYTEFPAFARTQMVPTTPRALMTRFRDRPLRFRPGSRLEYSNSGYVVLGVVIERVSGEPYDEFLRSRVLEPLHLANTGYDRQAVILPHRAAGYEKHGDTLTNAAPVDPSVAYAAGGMYSTVEDLFAWDEALYTDRLLSRASRAAMFTPHKDLVGYGWAIGTLFNRRLAHHNGEISGFVSNIARFPDQHVLIVVLSNRDGVLVDRITTDLAAIAFGEPYELPKKRQTIILDRATLDRYVGTFRITTDVTLAVRSDSGHLVARLSGGDAGPILLVPVSKTHFVSDNPPVDLVFTMDAQGRASEVTVNGSFHGTRTH